MRNTLRFAAFTLLSGVSLLLMFATASAGELVDIPASTTRALEYHSASNWFWGLNQAAGLALPLLLLATGWGARLYNFAARVCGHRRAVSLAAFAAMFFLLDRLVRLPVRYLWDRAYEQLSGTPGQALIPWLAGQASGWVLPIVGLTLVAIFGYWLMGKSPRRWWLWASAAVSILVLTFLLVEPFTQSYKPLGSSPLEQRIVELAARTGVPQSAIVIEHCEPASQCAPGRVIGMGPTRLMLLNDAQLAQSPESWTLQTVAHEAKHFTKDDNIKAFLLLSGLALAGLWLVHVAASAMVSRWSGRAGFSEIAHPMSLPLVVLLLSAFYLAVLPPVNAFRQHVELEADRFALELTRDNVAPAQFLACWASDKSRVTEWSTFFRLFRASHPSYATRINFFNTYHPWLDGKPLVYARDFTPQR
jgi:Zn-dependent protease with chaperone function